jgi:hypothetical protein
MTARSSNDGSSETAAVTDGYVLVLFCVSDDASSAEAELDVSAAAAAAAAAAAMSRTTAT